MECRKLAAVAVAAIIATGLAAVPEGAREHDADAQVSCHVTIGGGSVQGLDQGGACAFLGIPYASSTAGANRWRPPQPVAPWAPATLDAITPPASCPAVAVIGPPNLMGNEDCLKLNVWVSDPPPSAPAPVMVWLHTGAFIAASANFPGTNGRRLAEETGVIVVAPNYRLGPFGFLAHAALAAEDPDGSTGNYGLLDQRAALGWVHDNIAAFGGDPQNVTLAGSSAGGQSVGLHLVSPGSAGLFARAIVQSAYPTSRWTPMAEARAQGETFAAAVGCTDPAQVAACMRAATFEQVLTALPQFVQQVAEIPGRALWEPSVDGVVLPDQPRTLLEQGAFYRVPTIVGFNRDEGWGNFVNRSFQFGVSLTQYENWLATEFDAAATDVLALYPADEDATTPTPAPIEALARVTGDVQFVCEGLRLAKLVERTGTPTFLYSFEHLVDTIDPTHVIHGIESNILFGNRYAPPVFPLRALNDEDQALHGHMRGYWTRFAATGTPNTDDPAVVHWPAFKHPTGLGRGADKFIVLDADINEGLRPREEQCDFFEPFFFRSLLGVRPAAAP